ncbi:MAG: hypothetical protein WCR16_04705 [Bacilli bacterium]
MNLKEENKALRREVFELKFKIDIMEYRKEDDYEYRNIVEDCNQSLLDCYTEHLKTLKNLIDKYSYETVNNYFLQQNKIFKAGKGKEKETVKND